MSKSTKKLSDELEQKRRRKVKPESMEDRDALSIQTPQRQVMQNQQTLGNVATTQLLQRQLIQRDLPTTTTPTRLRSHEQRKSPWRTPDDEQERNWAPPHGTPIQDPFQEYELDSGPDCPAPPNSVWEKPPSHHQQQTPNPFRDPNADPPVVMNHWRSIERQKKWDAYRNAALHVQGVLTGVAPDVNRFFHAEKDSDLRALGMILPNKGWKGDLPSLAGKQKVPTKAGIEVSSVMGGPTKADEAGITKAAKSMESKNSGVEGTLSKCIQADEALLAAFRGVSAKAKFVSAQVSAVNSAAEEVKAFEASDAVDAAKAEIAKLKEEAEDAKKIIEFFTDLPKKLGELEELATKGMDPLAMIGKFANVAIDLVSEKRMEEAKKRLAAATQLMHDSKANALREKLQSEKVNWQGKIDDFSGATHTMREKLAARRAAYNEAGIAAGTAAGSNGKSNDRIAAMIAAIPIAEMVVGRLHAINSKLNAKDVWPAYSREGGIGYGIALYHKNSAAWNLPIALGLIQSAQIGFAMYLDSWEDGLSHLQQVKERIGGARPGGNSDNE